MNETEKPLVSDATDSEPRFKLKVSEVELEHLRQFTDNPTILKALKDWDREVHWKLKLKDLLTEMHLWPAVASIAENHEAAVVLSHRVRVKGKDLMGFKQDFIDNSHVGGGKEYDLAIELNKEIQFTKMGWDEAVPFIQEALDAIQVKYAAPFGCGLRCREGEFALERIFVDDSSAYEFRLFSADHVPTPNGNNCTLGFPATEGEASPDEVWARVRMLPVKKQLVKVVEGWHYCERCGLPMRPMDQAPASAAAEHLAGLAFDSVS